MAMSKVANKKYTFAFKENNYFDGKNFYDKYENAAFLQDVSNVKKILAQKEELGEYMKELKPGEQLTVEGMYITAGVPLVVQQSGCAGESDVNNDTFTARRLGGLAALQAVLKKILLFIEDAERLGVIWNLNNTIKYVPYYAVVPGTEYFTDTFGPWPLICALRKYEQKMISEAEVRRIAKITTHSYPTMLQYLYKMFPRPANNLQQYFVTKIDIYAVIDSLPGLGVY